LCVLRCADMSFTIGIPRRVPTGAILDETFAAIAASSILPARVIVVDNGEIPLSPVSRDVRVLSDRVALHVVRPQQNLGCASSWNLLRKLSAPQRLVLLNDDCAIAPDTFEKMFDHAESIVCAYGFSCVRIDPSAWEKIGDFDELFFPAYYEDTDYRRRAELVGVSICEWNTYPREEISPGRERSVQGICHGKLEPLEYKSSWFKACVEANKARYVAKWGGEPGRETHRVPFGTYPVMVPPVP
jgi:hypothetical protein